MNFSRILLPFLFLLPPSLPQAGEPASDAALSTQTFKLNTAPADLKAKVEDLHDIFILIGFRFDEEHGVILSSGSVSYPLSSREVDQLVKQMTLSQEYFALLGMKAILAKADPRQPVPPEVPKLFKNYPGPFSNQGLRRHIDASYADSQRYWDGQKKLTDTVIAALPAAPRAWNDQRSHLRHLDSREKQISDLTGQAIVDSLSRYPSGAELLSHFKGKDNRVKIPPMVVAVNFPAAAYYNAYTRSLIINRNFLVKDILDHAAENERSTLKRELSGSNGLLAYLTAHPQTLAGFIEANEVAIAAELARARQDQRGRLITEALLANVPNDTTKESIFECKLQALKLFHDKLLSDPKPPPQSSWLGEYKYLLSDFDGYQSAVSKALEQYPALPELAALQDLKRGAQATFGFDPYSRMMEALKAFGLGQGDAAIKEERSAAQTRLDHFLKDEYPRMAYDGWRRLGQLAERDNKPDQAFIAHARARLVAEAHVQLLGAKALENANADTRRSVQKAQEWLEQQGKIPRDSWPDLRAAFAQGRGGDRIFTFTEPESLLADRVQRALFYFNSSGYLVDERNQTLYSAATKQPLKVFEVEKLLAQRDIGNETNILERLNVLLSGKDAAASLSTKDRFKMEGLYADHGYSLLPPKLTMALEEYRQVSVGALRAAAEAAYSEAAGYWDRRRSPFELARAAAPSLPEGNPRKESMDESEQKLSGVLKQETGSLLETNDVGRRLLKELRGPAGRTPLPDMLIRKTDPKQGAHYSPDTNTITFNRDSALSRLLSRFPKEQREAARREIEKTALPRYLLDHPADRHYLIDGLDVTLAHELTHTAQHQRGPIDQEVGRRNLAGVDLLESEHEAYLVQNQLLHQKLLSDPASAMKSGWISDYRRLLASVDDWRSEISFDYTRKWPTSAASLETVGAIQNLRLGAALQQAGLDPMSLALFSLRTMGLNKGSATLKKESDYYHDLFEKFKNEEHPRMQYEGYRALAQYEASHGLLREALDDSLNAERAAKAHPKQLGPVADTAKQETNEIFARLRLWTPMAEQPAVVDYGENTRAGHGYSQERR